MSTCIICHVIKVNDKNFLISLICLQFQHDRTLLTLTDMKSDKRSHFGTATHHSHRYEAATVNEAQLACAKKAAQGHRLSHVLCLFLTKRTKILYNISILIKHLLWTACSIWAATWIMFKTYLWARHFNKHLFIILLLRKGHQCGIFLNITLVQPN